MTITIVNSFPNGTPDKETEIRESVLHKTVEEFVNEQGFSTDFVPNVRYANVAYEIDDTEHPTIQGRSICLRN